MKIMDIIDDKYAKNDTWIKDGVLMCNKECCGAPVSECSCDSSCKKCNCYNLKEEGILERYGMRAGSAGQRQAQSDMVNMNKRVNNKAQDQNREMMLRQKSANRRAGRLQTKTATGLPSRLLNPQQPQAPETQA
tara:strand:- start:2977 stop:3378 length:402 start_codon:yes stop_codon:yes gene_type:complete